MGIGDSIGENRDRNKDFLEVVEKFTVRGVEVSEDVLPSKIKQPCSSSYR